MIGDDDDPRSTDNGRLDTAGDGILVGRAVDGDMAAFEILVRRHAPLMRAYTRRLMGSADEVDDIVQEAFVTAWQRLPELDDPHRAKAWLMRVVSRKAIDRIRSRRQHLDIEQMEVAGPDRSSPSHLAEARSVRDALGRALAGLPDAQRQCWVLRESGGYSYDEIADELGVPRSTVRGLLARARQQIMAEMEAWR